MVKIAVPRPPLRILAIQWRPTLLHWKATVKSQFEDRTGKVVEEVQEY